MIGSGPTIVMASPIAPDKSPFVMDFPTRPATIESANTNRAKNSQGPNSSASEAKGPVNSIRQKAAQRPSDEGRPCANPDRAACFALFCHGKTIERRRDRLRRSGDADEACRDRAAGGSPDINADHSGQSLQRVEAEGERQHDDHCHRDGNTGQRTTDDASDGADQKAESDTANAVSCRCARTGARNDSHSAPRPARQQYRQIIFKDDVAEPGRCERHGKR